MTGQVPLSLGVGLLLTAILGASAARIHTDHLGNKEDCYVLQVGDWSPAVVGGDSILHRAPTWFGLIQRVRSDSTMELRPTIVIGRVQQVGSWGLDRDDQLEVAWSDGFTGLWIDFEKKDERMIGVAHLFTDNYGYSYAGATAFAAARQMTCPPQSQTEDIRQATF